jgi:ribonuclease Z
MKLHCLGTAGYHPSATRHTSCYFIPEANIMLDAGSGLFRVEKLLHQEEISILLTHAHLDHVLGLTFFLDFVAVTPLRKIHVYGEREKIEAIQKHLFHELLFPVLPPIEWHAIEELGRKFELNGATCSWFPLEHPGGSVGYRIDWQNISLAYVTDTTATPQSSYWREIQGVDWLLHECNFSDEWIELAIKTGHSWTSGVLESAAKAGISRLILAHINPLATDSDPLGLAAATAKMPQQTPNQILVASDSLVLDLSSL